MNGITKEQLAIGRVVLLRISQKKVPCVIVRIDRSHSWGGKNRTKYVAVNLHTQREINFYSAAKVRTIVADNIVRYRQKLEYLLNEGKLSEHGKKSLDGLNNYETGPYGSA